MYMMPACVSKRSECRRALCFARAHFPDCQSVPNLATIFVSKPLTFLWRSPTPELAAASTGAVRPTQQCALHCARRLPLDSVLVPVRPQSPRELRHLLLLSLTPLVAGQGRLCIPPGESVMQPQRCWEGCRVEHRAACLPAGVQHNQGHQGSRARRLRGRMD